VLPTDIITSDQKTAAMIARTILQAISGNDLQHWALMIMMAILSKLFYSRGDPSEFR
jgi:hypothetical protein